MASVVNNIYNTDAFVDCVLYCTICTERMITKDNLCMLCITVGLSYDR